MAQEAKYKMMFKMLDSDKSGHIDKNDFNKGLMKMVPQNQRDTIIKTLDKNGDGKVDYKEFKKLMKMVDGGKKKKRFYWVLDIAGKTTHTI